MSDKTVKISIRDHSRLQRLAEAESGTLSGTISRSLDVYEEWVAFAARMRTRLVRDLEAWEASSEPAARAAVLGRALERSASGLSAPAYQWKARGGGINESGPFRTATEAVRHMRLHDGSLPEGFTVWPEECP